MSHSGDIFVLAYCVRFDHFSDTVMFFTNFLSTFPQCFHLWIIHVHHNFWQVHCFSSMNHSCSYISSMNHSGDVFNLAYFVRFYRFPVLVMMHSFRHHFGKAPWFFLYDVIIYIHRIEKCHFYAPIGCIGLTLFTHDTRRKRRFLVPTQNKKSNYKICCVKKSKGIRTIKNPKFFISSFNLCFQL